MFCSIWPLTHIPFEFSVEDHYLTLLYIKVQIPLFTYAPSSQPAPSVLFCPLRQAAPPFYVTCTFHHLDSCFIWQVITLFIYFNCLECFLWDSKRSFYRLQTQILSSWNFHFLKISSVFFITIKKCIKVSWKCYLWVCDSFNTFYWSGELLATKLWISVQDLPALYRIWQGRKGVIT